MPSTASSYTNHRTDCYYHCMALMNIFPPSPKHAYAHLTTVRYGKGSIPQASSNVVMHCRAIFFSCNVNLIKLLYSPVLNILEH